MNKSQKLIVSKIKEGKFILSIHTFERMSERQITEIEIIEATTNLTSITYQATNDTNLIKGLTSSKETLTIVVAKRNNLIIVTVFTKDDLK